MLCLLYCDFKFLFLKLIIFFACFSIFLVLKKFINFLLWSVRNNDIKNFRCKHIILALREHSHYLNFSKNFSCLIIIFKNIFYQFNSYKITRFSVGGLDNFSITTIPQHFCHKVLFVACIPNIVQQNVLFSPSWNNFAPLFLLLIFHHLLYYLKKTNY